MRIIGGNNVATTKTGWEFEKRVHFDEIVTNYDEIRPNYPDGLFADLIAYAGTGAGRKALEWLGSKRKQP